MKSDHLTMYYRSPKAGKGSTDRHQGSPSPNELWDMLDRRANAKPFSTVRNVQLDPEILSENIFVSSPILRLHKSSPRFFIAHQKSPERALTTSRIIHDSSLQKFATLPSKSELSSTPTVLGDRVTNVEKHTKKESEGCIQAPKSSISLTKKTSRIREGPREVVIQLGDENEPLQMSQSEQSKTKRVSEEKRAQKPAIKICTDILIKGLSPRNMKDFSCKSALKTNEMGISCRNLTAQTTTSTMSTISLEERKHIRTNPISMSRQSTEDLHSRCEKSPLPKNKDYKAEAKFMQVLKTPENAKSVKRFEQTKRFKESKSFVEDNRRNMSKKKSKSKSKAESVLSSHKKSGYGSMLNSSSKKPDWNTIAIKKIELSLDSRDSFASKCRNARCAEQLEDLVVFKEVLEFFTMTSLCQITKVSKKFRSTKHLSLVKKAQCRVIINGLSYEEQYSFWDCQVNFAFLQKAYPLQYMMNSMKPSVFEKDILNDIDRTRNLPLSKQNTLQKILLAFSNALPKIGYLQGINSIAAVFLSQKLTEPEVYWLMKFIFQKKRFGEVFSDNFGKVHLLTYQLEIYIRNYLPRIVDHLGESEMSISYFATQWFITMFSYDLELSQLVKTWNLFLIKGWKVVIRIALSILWIFQDEICSKPADELPTFLKLFVMDKIANIPEEDLFGAAMAFKVSNRLLKYLETLYEHSAPINVILVSGHENKLQWKILPDDCTPRTISSVIPKDLMEYLNENIDHMKSVNRMKGDVCNQLDNYRNIPCDRANTSITLDSISVDYRSPMKLQPHSHHQVIKSSDLSFIQTLSSLGRKLKQILTPKSGSQSIYPHFKSTAEAELPDFANDRDLDAYTPLTEQSEHRSTQSVSRKTGRTPSASGHTAFKKSIVSVLKNSNAQLGINLIDHENFSVQRERDVNRRIAARSIMMPNTGNSLLNQTERKKPYAAEEQDRFKHKRNSSVNQESLNSLHEYKSICFGEMLNEKSEKHNVSQVSQVNQQGCTTPSECKTEPFDPEMDKSTESITKKKSVSSSKNFFLNGKYANKGKSFDKIKIVTSHHGRSGLTWTDYQRIYSNLDNASIPQERVATLTTPKEGKLRARTRQYDIRM